MILRVIERGNRETAREFVILSKLEGLEGLSIMFLVLEQFGK